MPDWGANHFKRESLENNMNNCTFFGKFCISFLKTITLGGNIYRCPRLDVAGTFL
jgi:hypothetical protein